MRGALKTAVTAAMIGLFAQKQHGPQYRQSSTKGWRTANQSPHFGKRKSIVVAILKDGTEKPMALKNALKKNLDFKI